MYGECLAPVSAVYATAHCKLITAITTVPFSRALNLSSLYSRSCFASWPNLSVEGKYLMRNSGADWLSCTIRSVEQIMERHGFEEDESMIEAPDKPTGQEHLSLWNRILRAARPLLRFTVI